MFISIGFGQDNNISIFRINSKNVFIKHNENIIDTISTNGIGKRFTFIKIDESKKRVYVSNHIIPGLDNFGMAYISLEIWTVLNGKLASEKVKLKLNNQRAKNVKIRFNKNEVSIICKKSFFKRERYFIPYENFSNLESFILP